MCLETSHAGTGVVNFGVSDAAVGGTYLISGLVPGRYLVEFIPCGGENLALQWYNRASRRAAATPVLVRPSHTTRNVNARLTAGGSITGRAVNKATGKPLAGVCVTALGVNEPFFGFGFTNRSGKYVVTGLNSSTYRLYLGSCGKVHVIPRVTSALRAIAGKTVAGPAVAMRTYQPGAISGCVAIARSSRNAASGACVAAMAVHRGLADSLANGFGTVGRGGFYRITGLVPGKYRVFFGDSLCGSGPDNLVPQWFVHASLRSKATVVSVAPGRTTHGISVTLPRDGAISGAVTEPKPAKSRWPESACRPCRPAQGQRRSWPRVLRRTAVT